MQIQKNVNNVTKKWDQKFEYIYIQY
jgi:hypothetical protein